MEVDEYTGSSTPSSKKAFVWCGNDRCETRDAASSYALLNQFFGLGETISGTSYYYDLDHLGSVREMTNSSGTIVWQQSFDPYGVPTTIVSTTPSDMGYAGYYLHSRSGLNLTRTRAYNASFGRFINRDPIEEEGGSNLYTYVDNDPVAFWDSLGLQSQGDVPPPADTSSGMSGMSGTSGFDVPLGQAPNYLQGYIQYPDSSIGQPPSAIPFWNPNDLNLPPVPNWAVPLPPYSGPVPSGPVPGPPPLPPGTGSQPPAVPDSGHPRGYQPPHPHPHGKKPKKACKAKK